MRKKLIISMAVFSATVLALAFSAIIAIEVTTSKMGRLLKNQQPESGREHFINRISTLDRGFGEAQAAHEPAVGRTIMQSFVSEIEKDLYSGGNHLAAGNKYFVRSQKPADTTQEALAEIGRTKTRVYILLGLVPVAAIVLSMYLVYGFIKPIDQLVKGARRIKKGRPEASYHRAARRVCRSSVILQRCSGVPWKRQSQDAMGRTTGGSRGDGGRNGA